MDISRSYEVVPAENDGFIVIGKKKNARTFGEDDLFRAAFSNATHLIAWLAKEHGVPFGGFDVSPEHVEVMKAAIAGERTPIYDELCEDEGCDHHGIPHVCVNWISWSGGERPVDGNTLVKVKFRNGRESHHSFARIWNWTHRSDTEPGDIVAYRVAV